MHFWLRAPRLPQQVDWPGASSLGLSKEAPGTPLCRVGKGIGVCGGAALMSEENLKVFGDFRQLGVSYCDHKAFKKYNAQAVGTDDL